MPIHVVFYLDGKSIKYFSYVIWSTVRACHSNINYFQQHQDGLMDMCRMILQILLIIVLILIGNVFDLGLIYDFSLVIISFFMIYHQFLLKKRQKEEYFKAFLNNNFIGMTAFLGIFLSVIIKS